MNEYDETLDYPLSFHVEKLFGKTDLDDHDVNYLTRTEMQYARTALALESGLATMGLLMSHCECEHLENSEMRDLGHFIAALIPASQILRDISSLAGDVLTEHRLEAQGTR